MQTPSAYLALGEFAAYGVPTTTTYSQVIQASAVVDSYLWKPQGLICSLDANGFPYAMASASPNASFTLTTSISPGTTVVATLAPALVTPDMIGEILTFDVAPVIESCQVVAYSGNNQVTLANVQFSHTGGAPVVAGLCVQDERLRGVQHDSPIVLSETPVANVLSILGKLPPMWAYGPYPAPPIPFSVPYSVSQPLWQIIPTNMASIDSRKGEITIYEELLPYRYMTYRVLYIAGWPETLIPTQIKVATAQIINTYFFLSGVPSSLKAANSGGPSLQRFKDTALDANVRQLLDPFKARIRWGAPG